MKGKRKREKEQFDRLLNYLLAIVSILLGLVVYASWGILAE